MSFRSPSPSSWNRLLSVALRALRRARLRKSRDVAAAMNLPLRSYEHFEAGGGRLNIERIYDFGRALDVDPHAILAAVMISSPHFAVRVADNKMIQAFVILLQEFDQTLGDEVANLETAAIVAAFSEAFDRLLIEARRKAEWRRTWLGEYAPPEALDADEGDEP